MLSAAMSGCNCGFSGKVGFSGGAGSTSEDSAKRVADLLSNTPVPQIVEALHNWWNWATASSPDKSKTSGLVEPNWNKLAQESREKVLQVTKDLGDLFYKAGIIDESTLQDSLSDAIESVVKFAGGGPNTPGDPNTTNSLGNGKPDGNSNWMLLAGLLLAGYLVGRSQR